MDKLTVVKVAWPLEGARAIQRLLMGTCFPNAEYGILTSALAELTRTITDKEKSLDRVRK
jgi:hypothetical protein